MPEKANQQLHALVALWEERRGSRTVPTRDDLPVKDLRPWLGSLALFEFPSASSPVFRLCGTSLHRRFGGEMTGKPVAALPPDIAEGLSKQLEKARAEKKPRQTRYSLPQQPPTTFHEVYLPLAGSARSGDLVLFASYAEGRT